MNKLLYLAVFLAIRVMRALYLPFRLLPVRNKITMISRQSDTPSIDMKLLQKAIQDRRPDYQVVILAKQLHNPVIYLIQIFRQMYHIATSRAVILDSYCIPISVLHHRKGLIVIQMWHSIGSMKKFGYAMLGKEEGSDPKLASLMCMHRNYTYVLISSFSYLKDYIEGFRISEDKVLQIPLPRADLLTDKAYLTARRKEIIKKGRNVVKVALATFLVSVGLYLLVGSIKAKSSGAVMILSETMEAIILVTALVFLIFAYLMYISMLSMTIRMLDEYL